MRGTRPAAVAGVFYPDGAGTLRREVDCHLLAADRFDGRLPKAVVAPHAGYPYSGPIAGNAFEPLRALAGRIERVVVIGPSHRVAFRGVALPAADAFATPLGPMAVDVGAAEPLLELPQVRVDAGPHAREHSIEVELPFLRAVLGEVTIVPLVVGDATPAEVAAVLERAWGGAETLIVVSSDLSHFLDYETARATDRRTADKVLALDPAIDSFEACGALALDGLALVARRLDLVPRLLDLRSSGDTAGDRERVVGYGAFSYAEAS